MDWGRAKNIILIVLLAVNVMLMTVYGIQYVKTQKNDSEIYNYTMEKMEEEGITLSCKIPDSGAKMASLSVKYQTVSSEKKKALLKEASERAALSDNDNVSEYIDKASRFAKNCGFNLSNCQETADINKRGNGQVIFQGYYGDLELKECYIKISFKKGIITDIDYKWFIPVGEGSTKQKLTSSTAAILSLLSDNAENRTEIAQASELDGKQDESGTEEPVGEDSNNDGDASGDLDGDSGTDDIGINTDSEEVSDSDGDSGTDDIGIDKDGEEVSNSDGDTDGDAGSDNDSDSDADGSVTNGDGGDSGDGRISLKGRKIVNIKLAYYVDDSDVVDEILYDTAFPAWEIVLDNGNVNYFFAFQQ